MIEAVRTDAERWGIRVEQLWIQDVRILPEIAKQFFDRVGARLEMEKARIEEEGRIRVQTVQAETELKVSSLQAQARAMHPVAVGRAYARIGKTTEVLAAYEELHRLSLLQPNRTVTFVGFNPGEVRALDAVMIPELESGKNAGRMTSIEVE
jgi:regulator of protease activity HflC (stomatin/prohibitin superfamily)